MGETGVTVTLANKLSAILGDYKPKFHYESPTKKNLKFIFERASKRRTDQPGFPDLIVELKTSHSRVIVVCECKKYLKDHGNADSDLKPVRYACSGVRHYLKTAFAAAQSKNYKIDFLGIAYTQEISKKGSPEKVNIYALNHRFNNLKSVQIQHLSSRLEEIRDFEKKIYDLKFLDQKIWLTPYNKSQIGLLPIEKLLQINFEFEPSKSIKFQRSLGGYKVEQIVKYYQDKAYHDKSETISPQGIILLGFFQNDYYIIDGQHRIEAYHKLYGKGYKNYKILFQLTHYSTLKELIGDFKAHNSGSGLTDFEKDLTDQLHQSVQDENVLPEEPKVTSNENENEVDEVRVEENNVVNENKGKVEKIRIESNDPGCNDVKNEKLVGDTVTGTNDSTSKEEINEKTVEDTVTGTNDSTSKEEINEKTVEDPTESGETDSNKTKAEKLETNKEHEETLDSDDEAPVPPDFKYLLRMRNIAEAATKVCDYYALTYRDIFNDNPRCYRPSIHYETMKRKLQLQLSLESKLKTNDLNRLIKDIKRRIDHLNTDFKDTYATDTKLSGAYRKCIRRGGFYLGLVRECDWIRDI